jgi:hypothetical protein
MRAKSMMLLAFVGGIGCAGGAAAPIPPQQARASAAKASPPRALDAVGQSTPAELLSEADQTYLSQLGATRGGQFEVDRQIAVLREAILLYTQFLDRAEGHPEFAAAIKKSRERIADCEATIIFLGPSANGAPPPALTE